jgi:hypothetical protein
MFNLRETLLVSAAVGFLLLWAGEVFQGVPFKQNYTWIMFSTGCFLAFQYYKNQRLKAQNDKPSPPAIPTKTKKKK